MNNIEISVIVLIGAKGFGLDRFIKSFLGTQPTEKIEIIFLYPDHFNYSFNQEERFARVKYLNYDRSSYFSVIEKAIKDAEADYILFQENHTTHKVNVIDALLRIANTNKYFCIGTLIYPGENMSFTDWTAYLSHYSGWGKGVKGGEQHKVIPGHNCVYKKSALLDLGDDLETYLFSDTILQWKLVEKGYKMYLTDEVYMIHDDKMTFTNLLAENFWFGWMFSYIRRKSNNWSISKRILYSILVFAKPIIRFKNMLKLPLSSYFPSKIKLLTILSAILLSFYWNALGESLGVLFYNKIVIHKFIGTH